MAAAGIYALKNNVNRLTEDHLNAKKISAALEHKHFVKCIMPVETNIIVFEVSGKYSAKSLAEHIERKKCIDHCHFLHSSQDGNTFGPHRKI